MRVGLLTRFLGYLGIIAGVLTIIPLVPIPIVEAYWLLALAYLLSGRWPSGVPPAWSSGRAEPWPRARSCGPLAGRRRPRRAQAAARATPSRPPSRSARPRRRALAPRRRSASASAASSIRPRALGVRRMGAAGSFAEAWMPSEPSPRPPLRRGVHAGGRAVAATAVPRGGRCPGTRAYSWRPSRFRRVHHAPQPSSQAGDGASCAPEDPGRQHPWEKEGLARHAHGAGIHGQRRPRSVPGQVAATRAGHGCPRNGPTDAAAGGPAIRHPSGRLTPPAGCRCWLCCPGSCPRRGPGQVRFARCLGGVTRSSPTGLGHSPGAQVGRVGLMRARVGDRRMAEAPFGGHRSSCARDRSP